MPTLPTPAEALKALRAQPGIDLTKQTEGTRIIVETDRHLFEIKLVVPSSGLVEISGSHPGLHNVTIGQYLRGVYVLDASICIDRWIGRTMQMLLRFRNTQYLSGPVVTAVIYGPGWTYDVF